MKKIRRKLISIKRKVRSFGQIEWGRVYYLRKSRPNESGFSVFLPCEDGGEWNLYNVSLYDSSLAGKNNFKWIPLKEAEAKGYVYDADNISTDESYPGIEFITFEDYADPRWTRENIPEEYIKVLADLGKDGIESRWSASDEDYLKDLIKQGVLYEVRDIKMLSTLEGYNLFNDFNTWRDKYEKFMPQLHLCDHHSCG